MPNIWTHICFCENVADTLRNPEPFVKQEVLMKLGAQGPDPFFYYNFWRLYQNHPVQYIGTLLHTKKCGPFLIDLIESAKNKRKEIRAYVFGFITHHILDRHTHPFIHYYAGYKENNHQKLEIYIDTLLMEKHHNLKTWKAPVYKEIDVGFSLDQDIVELIHQNIIKHFPNVGYKSPKYIQKTYRYMKLALRILADPYGWKNTLFGSIISPFSHRPVNDDKDYLNLNKETWYHSATNEARTDSFEDLYEQAKIEAVEILSEVLTYWHEGSEKAKTNLQNLIGNISYDTGLPLDIDLINQYSRPIV